MSIPTFYPKRLLYVVLFLFFVQAVPVLAATPNDPKTNGTEQKSTPSTNMERFLYQQIKKYFLARKSINSEEKSQIIAFIDTYEGNEAVFLADLKPDFWFAWEVGGVASCGFFVFLKILRLLFSSRWKSNIVEELALSLLMGGAAYTIVMKINQTSIRQKLVDCMQDHQLMAENHLVLLDHPTFGPNLYQALLTWSSDQKEVHTYLSSLGSAKKVHQVLKVYQDKREEAQEMALSEKERALGFWCIKQGVLSPLPCSPMDCFWFKFLREAKKALITSDAALKGYNVLNLSSHSLQSFYTSKQRLHMKSMASDILFYVLVSFWGGIALCRDWNNIPFALGSLASLSLAWYISRKKLFTPEAYAIYRILEEVGVYDNSLREKPFANKEKWAEIFFTQIGDWLILDKVDPSYLTPYYKQRDDAHLTYQEKLQHLLDPEQESGRSFRSYLDQKFQRPTAH